MANWWGAGGATGAVAAYEPIGAASLADSYINRVSPGTNNAAPGVAPTFDTATGWTFNGTTQYLTTGVVPLANWSLFVRFSGTGGGGNRGWHGSNASNAALYTLASTGGGAFWAHGSGFVSALNDAGGVMATVGARAYRDGALVSAIGGSFTGTATALTFGRLAGSTFAIGNVQAAAIYDDSLIAGKSAAEITALALAISDAMAALPTGGSWGGVVVPMPILMSGQVR